MSNQVLIVESNTLLVKMYRCIFQTMACRVEHAPTVTEAIRALHDINAQLIILDDRVVQDSSVAASRELQDWIQASKTPLIGTVNRSAKNARAPSPYMHYSSVVSKPFQLEAFSAIARQAMTTNHPSALTI
jgi:DNA-binding response OmpR family regulator